MKLAFLGDSITEGVPGVSYVDMVQKQFPEYEITNLGKGGDTVKSLYKRIKKIKNLKDYDKLILFIGVNDTYGKISGKYKIMKTLSRQRWSRNNDYFILEYKKLVEHLLKFSNDIIIIPPLLCGEMIHNEWNEEITERETEIEVLSRNFEEITYLDLHNKFRDYLEKKEISDFMPHAISLVARDVATLKTKELVNEKSKERRLHLTLDGVHLNEKGASLIAKEIIKTLKKG